MARRTTERLRQSANNVAERLGFSISRYQKLTLFEQMRMNVLGECSVALDVGANLGQWAQRLRTCGWQQQIVSFEAQLDVATRLEELARPDPHWQVIFSAVGALDDYADFFIASNAGAASSFYTIHEETTRIAPQAESTHSESVQISRLDSLIAPESHSTFFLKADVQGYELEVLQGAEGLMPRIVGLELELSLVAVYRGQPKLTRVLQVCEEYGFDLVHIEPEFADRTTGQLLQVNALFCRQDQPWLTRFS